MRRLRFPAFCLAFAVLIAGCGASEDAGRGDDSALSAAADLRVQVERLVREHVYLAAIMTEAAATDRVKEYKGAASTLDDNAVALALVLRDQYGEDAERGYLRVLRQYQTFLAAFPARLANKKKTATIVKRLDAFPPQYGVLMASITPLLNPFVATKQMDSVVSAIKSFSASQAKKDFAKADVTLRTAGGRAGTLGASIANAIIEDHPANFSGNPDAPAALFRYTLSGLLEENVYVLSLATQDSVTHRSAELKASTAALQASSKALVSHLASLYGSGFQKAFTPIWERQSNLLLAYAAAGKDKTKKAKAVADLAQHDTDLTTFFVGANKDLDRSEMSQLFGGLVSALKAVVDAQVAGDFVKAGVAIRSAAQATEGIGASLTQGTVLKFPAKFRPARAPARSPTPSSTRSSGG